MSSFEPKEVGDMGDFFKGIGSWPTIIAAFVATAAAGWSSFPTVETGHVGVRYRFGKVWYRHKRKSTTYWRLFGFIKIPKKERVEPYPFIVQAGIKFAPYGLYGLKVVSVQPRELSLNAFDVDLTLRSGKKEQHHIDAKAIWRVLDKDDYPVRAVVTGQNNLDDNIRNLCGAALRRAYEESGHTAEELLGNSQLVFAAMNKLDGFEKSLAEYGVVLDSLQLLNTARSFGEMVASGGQSPQLTAATAI